MGLAKTSLFLFFLIMGTSGMPADENEQRAQRGGLGRQGVTNVRSEEHRYEGIPKQYQIPRGMEINEGSVITYNGKIVQYEPAYTIEAFQDQLNSAFNIKGDGYYTQTKGPVQINNRFIKSEVASQASSPSLNSQNEEKAQDNTESQAHSTKRNSSNKQLSLSFDILYFYLLVVLSPYYLF